MNTIGQRLDYALSLKSKKKGSLAKSIGVHASTIDNYIKNKVKNPSSLILEKIASYLDINSDWLILNMGEMNDVIIKEDSIEGFETLNIENKLNKIYSMVLNLKKGQDIPGEVIMSLSKDNN